MLSLVCCYDHAWQFGCDDIIAMRNLLSSRRMTLTQSVEGGRERRQLHQLPNDHSRCFADEL